MSDAEVATETAAEVTKGRGRPKGKAAKAVDGDKPDKVENDVVAETGRRGSQRKAATAASNAMKEQAIGASKRDNEGADDGEPKAKRGRGRAKAAPKKTATKTGKKGRPKKTAPKKKAESESEGAEGNTEEESHGE